MRPPHRKPGQAGKQAECAKPLCQPEWTGFFFFFCSVLICYEVVPLGYIGQARRRQMISSHNLFRDRSLMLASRCLEKRRS